MRWRDVWGTCASDGGDASDHAAHNERQHHHLEQVEEHVAEQRDGADDLQRLHEGSGGRCVAAACLLARVERLDDSTSCKPEHHTHNGLKQQPGEMGGGGGGDGKQLM